MHWTMPEMMKAERKQEVKPQPVQPQLLIFFLRSASV
jgi:hypothetical protein